MHHQVQPQSQASFLELRPQQYRSLCRFGSATPIVPTAKHLSCDGGNNLTTGLNSDLDVFVCFGLNYCGCSTSSKLGCAHSTAGRFMLLSESIVSNCHHICSKPEHFFSIVNEKVLDHYCSGSLHLHWQPQHRIFIANSVIICYTGHWRQRPRRLLLHSRVITGQEKIVEAAAAFCSKMMYFFALMTELDK